MKSMEDYISEVYEKYERVEKNNITYKKVKMKYHNPLPALCGIAACLIIVLVCGNLFGNKANNMVNPNKENIHMATEEKEDGKIIYNKYIRIDNESTYKIDRLIKRSDCIAIVSKIDIESCNYKIKNDDIALTTNGYLEVNEILKSEKSIYEKRLEYYMISGMISLAELEKDKTIDWKKWEIENLGKIIPDNEKEFTFFKQVPIKRCEIEEGKQYLVFLKYDEEKDKYNIWDYVYGVMEYDPITKMVKNIDTGEFEEFDWDLINEK